MRNRQVACFWLRLEERKPSERTRPISWLVPLVIYNNLLSIVLILLHCFSWITRITHGWLVHLIIIRCDSYKPRHFLRIARFAKVPYFSAVESELHRRESFLFNFSHSALWLIDLGDWEQSLNQKPLINICAVTLIIKCLFTSYIVPCPIYYCPISALI